jgi:hypothetical protein
MSGGNWEMNESSGRSETSGFRSSRADRHLKKRAASPEKPRTFKNSRLVRFQFIGRPQSIRREFQRPHRPQHIPYAGHPNTSHRTWNR